MIVMVTIIQNNRSNPNVVIITIIYGNGCHRSIGMIIIMTYEILPYNFIGMKTISMRIVTITCVGAVPITDILKNSITIRYGNHSHNTL